MIQANLNDDDSQPSEPVSPHDLIIRLARSLHTSGAPAYELEQRMEQASRAVGVPATFFSTPTSVFITFENPDKQLPDFTRLLRVWPTETNLAKLTRLHVLEQQIQDGTVGVESAWRRLQQLEAADDDYGDLFNVLSFATVSVSVATLIGGNATVLLSAGIVGALVGVLARGFDRWKISPQLTNVVAGFTATLAASLIHHWFPSGNIDLTILAAIIILLPGLQITVSVNELATQNLASGSARFAGAMTGLLTIVFGVVMGYGLAGWMFPLARVQAIQPISNLWLLVVFLPTALAFCVLFRAKISHLPWIFLSIAIGYGTVRLAGSFLNPMAAAWSAALVVGTVSNGFARLTNLPAAIMLMPGLLLLVPGSLGFLGISEIARSEELPMGIELTIRALLIAVSLVTGLLVSNTLTARMIRPKPL